uniref:CYTH domain protein n=1 Tax=Pithovirus LCPAC401 TaxID=2506595 RepID=A0A481ZAJ2_9VIRU|nr:MAG: CYTH domain protein [Pithovirus LCPAC401]
MSKQNIEIKAKLRVSIEEFENLVQEYTRKDKPDEVIIQHDTFFKCSFGRLKLRIFHDGIGELISYKRDNINGPKISIYSLYPTQNPMELKKVLSESLEILGEVVKKRLLYMHNSTRIHIDEVKGLKFPCMELEVTNLQSSEEGIKICSEIKKELNIQDEDLLEVSYFDLLLETH